MPKPGRFPALLRSDRYLTDAYCETTLKGKIAGERDTTEMPDILTGTGSFGCSTCCGSRNVYDSFPFHIQSKGKGGADLAPFAAKQDKSFTKLVQKIVDA